VIIKSRLCRETAKAGGGLRPKVTRAGARNILCAAERKEAVGDKRERIATPV